MCLKSVLEINWHYIGDGVPAFLTLIIIPLTYKSVFSALFVIRHSCSDSSDSFSIAYGVIAGIISYILLNGIPLAIRRATGGRLVPADYDRSEAWVIPPGGILPPWVAKIFGIKRYESEDDSASASASSSEHVDEKKEEPVPEKVAPPADD